MPAEPAVPDPAARGSAVPESADPSGPATSERVADLGEDALLARLFPLLPRGEDTLVGPGDDAAVLAVADGRLVVTTDVLVEEHHFRRAWSSGYDVGRRAAVQNVADVAAMGARPTAVVVGLVAPGDLPVSWVLDLGRGLADVCGPLGAGVVGGDLSGGERVVVAVTVHGSLDGRAPVLRSGARPGDVVAHAGVRGRSAAGYALLASGVADPTAPGPWSDLVAGYLRPTTPAAAGVEAARAGATAMLDVSDGLLRDAGRLARASGVTVDLCPVADAFAEDLAALGPAADRLGQDPVRWVLAGGEDHGLLATFPPGAELPAPFRAVGTVREAGDTGVLVDGRPDLGPTGWDHFGGGGTA